MKYPLVTIDLCKIYHNTKKISEKCKQSNVDLVAVTKAVRGNYKIANAMISGGANKLADSRIENIINLKKYGIVVPCVLLRAPMQSELRDVIDWVDVCLVSELDTIKNLDRYAKIKSKVQQIILMIETGDLREGIMPADAIVVIEKIFHCQNIELIGIGTNLACLSGTIPTVENMNLLIELKDKIFNLFNYSIKYISGANSSSIYLLLQNKIPPEINQIRVGEGILLGRETIAREKIPSCYQDAFQLKAEIIEIKRKPSLPFGITNQNAFGETIVFKDNGIQLRAILSIGKQDVDTHGIFPKDHDIQIIGSNSDQLVIDLTKCSKTFKIGSIISFDLNYSALLTLMTSDYVRKVFKQSVPFPDYNSEKN